MSDDNSTLYRRLQPTAPSVTMKVIQKLYCGFEYGLKQISIGYSCGNIDRKNLVV